MSLNGWGLDVKTLQVDAKNYAVKKQDQKQKQEEDEKQKKKEKLDELDKMEKQLLRLESTKTPDNMSTVERLNLLDKNNNKRPYLTKKWYTLLMTLPKVEQEQREIQFKIKKQKQAINEEQDWYDWRAQQNDGDRQFLKDRLVKEQKALESLELELANTKKSAVVTSVTIKTRKFV